MKTYDFTAKRSDEIVAELRADFKIPEDFNDVSFFLHERYGNYICFLDTVRGCKVQVFPYELRAVYFEKNASAGRNW